jgi:hypothetical protein
MAYTTINKHTDYFNTLLYTGTGSATTVSGVGFQPDFFWIKQRSSNQGHLFWDVTRGGNYYLPSNGTAGSNADIGTFTAASDGYSLATDGAYNGSSETYVGWNWKAGTTSGLTTNGTTTITPTSYSFNSTAGFSILKYTGNGAAGAYVAHGLGTTPTMIIVKKTSGSAGWFVYHQKLQSTYNIYLNTTDAEFGGAYVYSPDATNFRLRDHNDVNQNGETYVAYCFADKTGYSKFGSYTGNGASDGTFIYTGFKPKLIILKRTDTTGNWVIEDNKRIGYNELNYHLYPNLQNAEGTNYFIDQVSNGFKIRGSSGDTNGSGGSYIYMALGQSLVGSNNVPCTAR